MRSRIFFVVLGLLLLAASLPAQAFTHTYRFYCTSSAITDPDFTYAYLTGWLDTNGAGSHFFHHFADSRENSGQTKNTLPTISHLYQITGMTLVLKVYGNRGGGWYDETIPLVGKRYLTHGVQTDPTLDVGGCGVVIISE